MNPSEDSSTLRDWWKSHYGDFAPIPSSLKHQIPDRWLRIHSLPDSIRYPKTPDDYSTLLARHNTVATDILGAQSPCLLMVGRYIPDEEPVFSLRELPMRDTIQYTLFGIVNEQVWEPIAINIWCAPVA